MLYTDAAIAITKKNGRINIIKWKIFMFPPVDDDL